MRGHQKWTGFQHQNAQRALTAPSRNLVRAIAAEHAAADNHHIKRGTAVFNRFIPGIANEAPEHIQ